MDEAMKNTWYPIASVLPESLERITQALSPHCQRSDLKVWPSGKGRVIYARGQELSARLRPIAESAMRQLHH
jgi:hypothetical protein